MTVTREDVESYLTAISTWKSLCVKYPATVPMNVELNVTTSLDALNGIEQVLEDRLNQPETITISKEQMEAFNKALDEPANVIVNLLEPDWKSIAEEQNIILQQIKKMAIKSMNDTYYKNNMFISGDIANKIIDYACDTISKYEQAIKGGE